MTSTVGFSVGTSVGALVGVPVGVFVGKCVGAFVGALVGALVSKNMYAASTRLVHIPQKYPKTLPVAYFWPSAAPGDAINLPSLIDRFPLLGTGNT